MCVFASGETSEASKDESASVSDARIQVTDFSSPRAIFPFARSFRLRRQRACNAIQTIEVRPLAFTSRYEACMKHTRVSTLHYSVT